MPFSCSICVEESTRICVRCTKDACDNHLCEKCRKCSDCCECEVALAPHPPETVREAMHAAVAHAETVAEVAVVPEMPANATVQAPGPVSEAEMEAVAQAPVADALSSVASGSKRNFNAGTPGGCGGGAGDVRGRSCGSIPAEEVATTTTVAVAKTPLENAQPRKQRLV